MLALKTGTTTPGFNCMFLFDNFYLIFKITSLLGFSFVVVVVSREFELLIKRLGLFLFILFVCVIWGRGSGGQSIQCFSLGAI